MKEKEKILCPDNCLYKNKKKKEERTTSLARGEKRRKMKTDTKKYLDNKHIKGKE